MDQSDEWETVFVWLRTAAQLFISGETSVCVVLKKKEKKKERRLKTYSLRHTEK